MPNKKKKKNPSKLRLKLTLLVTAIIIVVGAASVIYWPTFKAIQNPDVEYLDENNPEFIKGKKQAQENLEEFITAVNENKCTSTHECSIKKDFYNGQNNEHMWVVVSSYKEGKFYGQLETEPIFNKELKLRDDVVVSRGEVEDWKLAEKGKKTYKGGFTIEAVHGYVPGALTVTYSGEGVFQHSRGDMGFVFEDDSKTGYFYATNKDHTQIYDALQLFNYDSPDQPQMGEEMLIVVNEELQKVGVFYNDKFHAVFDYKNQKGSNLLNSPNMKAAQWNKPHNWHSGVTEGLE